MYTFNGQNFTLIFFPPSTPKAQIGHNHRNIISISRTWILDFGFWILDFGF